ncbi:SKP1-like protein 14 [Lycium barbarum]|uniref:SKP1-like protein 14 n=1 Tax=Lycium barbarum TaxID=112863 RepID=UPI00293F1999|nr:SKP1-like protein 14 [Lycium barbarum]
MHIVANLGLMAAATLPTIEKRVLTLKSSDGDEFELEESIAIQSLMIKKMVEDGCAVGVIPLFNVDTETLTKIIEYLKMHQLTSNQEEIKNYDKEMVRTNLKTLFNFLSAANFLDIMGLLDLCSKAVADRIKHKSIEAVQEMFNITSDFTPEEEAAIRNENPHAFEGDFDHSLD